MKKVFAILVSMLFVSSFANGQSIIYSDKVTKISHYHATVGTTTAVAIAAPDTNILGWKICNDAVNTSTYLLVEQAVDVSTDGTMLGLGQCFDCPNCTGALLKLMKLEGQAASNGYSVIQYRK